ncbi:MULTISPECIES: hypothetical protein [unclassified Streptomyces]|uniref:hypothetical protein n=1 Tax=unclassified Streptomyces TaxID=2593676 RepID=UPI0004BD92E9|nr:MULTISPECIES: hypothetical protein [Streptomyces]KMS89113.1 hypothetical protein ACZ91_21645 [Streptomyces regensis]KOG64845.1 hypothetical protein ADK77_20340 [Streptomyces antibioticus]KOV91367.1 hypothetical protein ADL02_13165 [Streptomyces sp. NRRL WC-3723]
MRLHKGIARGTRPAGVTAAPARTGTTAQRVLIAQGVALGALAFGLLVLELPGIIREVRIWRMINLRSGAKRPR